MTLEGESVTTSDERPRLLVVHMGRSHLSSHNIRSILLCLSIHDHLTILKKTHVEENAYNWGEHIFHTSIWGCIAFSTWLIPRVRLIEYVDPHLYIYILCMAKYACGIIWLKKMNSKPLPVSERPQTPGYFLDLLWFLRVRWLGFRPSAVGIDTNTMPE